MNNSKNDKAWRLIFDKYKIINNILNDGHFKITAKNINEFREARLMTKFDHKSQLPKIFSENSLSILPTSRGGYIIVLLKPLVHLIQMILKSLLLNFRPF